MEVQREKTFYLIYPGLSHNVARVTWGVLQRTWLGSHRPRTGSQRGGVQLFGGIRRDAIQGIASIASRIRPPSGKAADEASVREAPSYWPSRRNIASRCQFAFGESADLPRLRPRGRWGGSLGRVRRRGRRVPKGTPVLGLFQSRSSVGLNKGDVPPAQKVLAPCATIGQMVISKNDIINSNFSSQKIFTGKL